MDLLTNLFKIFVAQFDVNISFSSFCRSRPFWVTKPKTSDRETCACAKHSNFELLVSSLSKKGIIEERSYREIVKLLVCSEDSEDCMLAVLDLQGPILFVYALLIKMQN